MKGFKKCCISSAVNGTDDDLLWNDGEEDGCECKENEGTVLNLRQGHSLVEVDRI